MLSQYTNLDELNLELARDMGELADYPYDWVMYAYPWGRGELKDYDGPDDWQKGFLIEWGEEIRARGFDGFNPVEPIRFSTASGHGIGKSAFSAWIVDLIMSTRPHCKGIVTANTSPQLETKTWAEIAKWTKRCITAHWFRVTSGRGAMKMVHRDHPETWRVDGMAWRANQPEAFAGLHAATSTPFYLFDEASGVPKSIFETANGGMTDGEPMMFLFSNFTKASGYFYESHTNLRHRYLCRQIDSRKAKMTNKAEIQKWIEDYGLDSDYVRVRVLGEPPNASAEQFIPTNIVDAAMDAARTPHCTLIDPIIIGVDVARFGGDESTIYIRQGLDCRTHKALHFRGMDTTQLSYQVRKLATDLLADAINVDGGGVGGGVIDNLRNWSVPNVNEIHFGGTSPDSDYANMATYMMAETRSWLKREGSTLPLDPVLKRQLTSREYRFTDGKRGTAVIIESKEEMRDHVDKKESPDRADGLGLTFAVPVGPRDIEKTRAQIAGLPFSNVIGDDYER